MADISPDEQRLGNASAQFYGPGVAPEQVDSALDEQRPAWQGVGRETGAGLLRGFPVIGQELANVTAGVMLGGQMQDRAFHAINDPGNPFEIATNFYTPTAHTTGKAAQWVGHLAELPGQIIGSGGQPEVMALGSAMQTGKSAVDQGAGTGTAVALGALSGISTEVGMKIPVVGSTLPTRIATGAAGFTAASTAATAAQQAIAPDNMKAQFDPWDKGNFLANVLSGGMFGVLHHLSTPSETDATLTLANAKSFQSDTAPGTPLNAAAVVGHQDAMEAALHQANAGQAVSVADRLPPGAQFAPRETSTATIEPTEPDVQRPYADFRRTLESGGRADAVNSRSNAVGADQFIPKTWLAMVAQEKPAWAEGLSKDQVLALRTDPEKSGQMAAALDRQNSAALDAAGVPITNENLYAAHHFGAGDAIKFAKAADDTPISDILPKKVIDANPYLKGKTKAEVMANWDKRAGESPDAARTAQEAPQRTQDETATTERPAGESPEERAAREPAPLLADETRTEPLAEETPRADEAGSAGRAAVEPVGAVREPAIAAADGADATGKPAAGAAPGAPRLPPAVHAAAAVAESRPNLAIVTGVDEHGEPIKQSLADAHQAILDEHAQSLKEADAYETAVNCYIGVGA